jgi:hypothetical protein
MVMPFGPTNRPATFISFIYNINSQCKSLANSANITIGDDTNTQIIIGDLVSHGADADTLLHYMECQLRVCQLYRLSLSGGLFSWERH